MAQNRADLTPTSNVDPETLPGQRPKPSETTAPHDLPSMSSIDKLLALTDDDGWDIEDQVRTLQTAAEQKLASLHVPKPPPSRPAPLRLPTPYELGPSSGPGATPIAVSTNTLAGPPPIPSPLPAQARQKPSIPPPVLPPPLPPGMKAPSRSKGPPPLPPRASERPPAPPPPPPKASDLLSSAALIDLLTARASTLDGSEDKVGLARVQMELAIAHELLGDEAKSTSYAEAALKIDADLASAHALLRRRKHGRSNLAAMLAHLERELAAATEESGRVELLIEKARLLEATLDRSDAVRATWEQALTHAPHHAAALRGLEAELTSRAAAQGAPEAFEALAAHLGHMADAYGSEPRLAAWLHVERAQILEKKLGRVDAARGALERALELDSGVGPVRNAFVRHVAARQDAAALVDALEQEAQLEPSPIRSARLELEAACIAAERLGDPGRSIALLERAASRAPTQASIDRRTLDDLVRLREARGEWGEAARARRARLRFVTDPSSLASELRTLATIAERLGDLDSAIADVQRALSLDDADPTIVETLDRLLGAAGKDEQRVALWLTEAARTEEGTKRARALTRAANISEHALGRPADAVRHLRSAWIASPGDSEVLDGLSRLLTPAPSETADTEGRALIDLYSQAAQHSHDAHRRVAYLERIALVWEVLVGDARRAARVYEEILTIEPGRRAAILGLGRNAARVGDDRALAQSLLDEARLAEDGVDVLALRTRAATAMARVDASRALSLVTEVLAQEPAHAAARALETRIHEEARRWEAAAQSLRKRIEHAPKQEKLGLWLALAQIQDTRLHAPHDALASLKAAHALDPRHPVPPEAIARMLETTGDYATLCTALEGLAADAPDGVERARHLLRAGEIQEHRLGDDARATQLYVRALAEAPDDDLVVDRLMRVLTRRLAATPTLAPGPSSRSVPPGKASVPPPPLPRDSSSMRAAVATPSVPPPANDLVALLNKRLERASGAVAAQAITFELALLMVEHGQEMPRATALLEALVEAQPDHIPALRTIESITRKTGAWAPLARVLDREAEAFLDMRARLGTLWNLAALEEWRLPVSDPTPTYVRILEIDPTDPGALEATLRRELANARRGEPRARKLVIGALRALCGLSADDSTRLAIQLRLGILLEQVATDATDGTALGAAREALDRYRDALQLDSHSVTATTGLARLSGRLNDAAGAAAAATSLADLAVDPHTRARYLIDAAEILLGPDATDAMGTHLERSDRAAALLERALASEPDSIPAAARLATIRLDRRQSERLVDTFRTAIAQAKTPEAIIHLGTEIAHVARDELRDLTIAIDAMRRVREAAPQHVPSLLTLAELCIAQRAWPEAVDALEEVVSTTRDAAPRLTALFALASIYEKVLSKPADAERVLRAALATDPANPRALRALLRRLSTGTQGEGSQEGPKPADPNEIAELLGRLADVERDPEQKCNILLELSEIRLDLNDPAAAERALVEAVAQNPSNAKAFAKLATLAHTPKGQDAVRYARSLNALVARGGQLGRVDPRWLATLGQLEIESLNRIREGIAHLHRAVKMDATLYETRYELASAYAKAGAHEDAVRTLTALVLPDSTPLLRLVDPGSALAQLERSLGGVHRSEDALVVSELRAIAGELDDGRHAWLRARRLGPVEPQHAQLDRATLVTHVLPPEGRHVLLEVAAAVVGIEARMLRADLTELGLSPRDRVSARSNHPLRALLDRVARTLSVGDIELVIASTVSRTRVLAHDVPWVVVPRSLGELPEPTQIASLARAVARIAFGVPWLEELPPPHIEALLIACARQAVGLYAADDIDVFQSKVVAQYEPTVARVITRRQKKLLEELAPHIAAPQGRPIPVDVFVNALARAELRAAYLVCGDLLATVDEMRAMDAALFEASERPGPNALSAVLQHTFAGDVCRYALTPEATALRRRIGSTWT